MRLFARIGVILAAALLVVGVLIGFAKAGSALGMSAGEPRARPAQGQLISGSQTNAAGQPRGGDHEMSQSANLGQAPEMLKSLVPLALVGLAVGGIGRLIARRN